MKLYLLIIFHGLYLMINSFEFNDGTLCKINETNLTGFCTNIIKCSSILLNIKNNIFNHTGCGYINQDEYVCCSSTNNNEIISNNIQVLSNRMELIDSEKISTSQTTKISRTTEYYSTENIKKIYSRISEKKCKEYQEHVYDTLKVRTVFNQIKYVKKDICPLKVQQLVLGGTQSKPKEFPHMALIGIELDKTNYKWVCGGSLISERFILTAAHCKATQSPVYPYKLKTVTHVLLGELDFSNDNDIANPIKYNIEKFILHPDYDENEIINDIALIKLNATVTFNSYIRPACLPLQIDYIDQQLVIATGWGFTLDLNETTYNHFIQSSHMLKVILEKLSIKKCSFYENNEYNNKKLDDNLQICSGSSKNFKDVCKGDSGGPLQMYHSDQINFYCMYTLIGITSYGADCDNAQINEILPPGIYTKIFTYLDWIETEIWPNEKF